MESNYRIAYGGELSHHGVKGMKWGVRKDKKSSGSHATYSDDYKRTIGLREKDVSEMSNQELRDFNNRLQLENQYKSLNSRNVSSGRKFVQSVLYDAAKNIATEYTKKYMKKGISHISKM